MYTQDSKTPSYIKYVVIIASKERKKQQCILVEYFNIAFIQCKCHQEEKIHHQCYNFQNLSQL